MNSFATFKQPYFCCKTKFKIKFTFYRMSLYDGLEGSMSTKKNQVARLIFSFAIEKIHLL